MRTITVSTDVFAKIWAKRKEGEEMEDDILRRVLDLPKGSGAPSGGGGPVPSRDDGFRDPRSGVHFTEGFEIFRNYKGTEFRARATRGRWRLLNDNQYYPSLHKLSWAVVHGHENSWMNWKFEKSPGTYVLIDKLRDPAKVPGRKPPPKLEDF